MSVHAAAIVPHVDAAAHVQKKINPLDKIQLMK